MGNWNAVRWTEEMDAAVRAAYQSGRRGVNKALARKFGLEPRSVSRRAALLGLPSLVSQSWRRNRPETWSPDEIALVAAHRYEPIPKIRARLTSKGFCRSADAVRGLIRREIACGRFQDREGLLLDRGKLLLPAVASGMGVLDNTVRRWLQSGWLRGNRIGGKDEWTISMRDLRVFLFAYPGHWDHRRADKYFLLDIFTHGDKQAYRLDTQRALEAA